MNQTLNVALQKAKNSKNDEWYTTRETVEKEVKNYWNQLKGKIILCNCDDPVESEFSRYFLRNFSKIGIRELICTSYADSKIAREKADRKHGTVIDITDFSCDADISDDDLAELIRPYVKRLHGNGDFMSDECIGYLKKADVCITNPPFSKFKQIFGLLMTYSKHFLLIGNMNAITYKEIFEHVIKNHVWLGYHNGEMAFRVPDSTEPRKTRFWIDESGQKWRSLGNAMWLTNLDVSYRHQPMELKSRYDESSYQKFDNFDAICVPKVAEIPYDYDGIMAVPLTILTKYSPDQFEIIGEANHGSDNQYDLFKPIINGKELFKKILIRRKVEKSADDKEKEFRILDLFCGAGGFSAGMHKNRAFKTVLASDFNADAAETFKFNMPEAEIIVGDISDSSVKEEIIRRSRELKVNMIIGGPPCQGFSLKGKKLGLDDPRNFLFVEYLKIVEAVQPEVFVIENVKALMSTSAGWFKSEIESRIRKMGYKCSDGILNAKNFGVPQSRERAVFICSKDCIIPLPTGSSEIVTVRDAISDLSYLDSGEGQFESEYRNEPMSDYQVQRRIGSDRLYNHKASNHKDIAIRKLSMIPPEKGREYLPAELIGKQQFRSTWGRLVWDDISPTIDTRFDASSNGKNNHPYLNRAITPREAARLQSFDDTFVFVGKKIAIRQQIGNAVPPLMGKAIADQIEKSLKNGVKMNE